MGNLFSELKRRNVFRVGVAYVVVGWLLAQAAELVLPTFGAPEWVLKSLIFVLLLGLPVALFLAWAFELTPEGMKRTEDVNLGESITPATGHTLDRVIILVLVVALGWFAWERFAPSHGDIAAAGTAGVEKSVAVLPFVNMSNDPDQEFFSDGISEELLNVLAKLPNLRVAARTSSFQFKGDNRDISEIGKRLGVNHVLEGSVRKAGTKLRITAQLIDVANGFHVWSETYDRELDDVFAIQDEIAAAIATALKVHLGGNGETAVADDAEIVATPRVAQTTTPEAYERFLLGRHLIVRREKSALEAAVEHFKAVLEADPDYAPAWSALGEATLLLEDAPCCYGDLTNEEVTARAGPALRRALDLDPGLAGAHAAMGLLLDDTDKEAALRHFDKAIEINPNLARAHMWRSSTIGEMGRTVEAFDGLQRAQKLDPLSTVVNLNMARHLYLRSRFDESGAMVERVMQLSPGRGLGGRGELHHWMGDYAATVETYLRANERYPDDPRNRFFSALMLIELGLPGVARPMLGEDAYFADWAEGKYEAALESAREAYFRQPEFVFVIRDLATSLWLAGDLDGAIRQYRRIFELEPGRAGNESGIGMATQLAHVEALGGDKDAAGKTLAMARAGLNGIRSAGIDNYRQRANEGAILAQEGRKEEALAAYSDAIARGWLPLVTGDYPVPREFLESAEFQEILSDIEASRAAARKAVAERVCAGDSDIPDTPLRAAVCAALIGA